MLKVGLSVIAAFLLVGCAKNKPLLVLLPEAQPQVHLSLPSEVQSRASYSTISGQRGREVMAGGLLGVAIGGPVSAIADRGGDEIMKQIRAGTNAVEAVLIQERFRQRLLMAGVEPVGENNTVPSLELTLMAVGLREVQRQFFAPFARVQLKLKSPDGQKISSTVAQSVGTKLRSLEEFKTQPELYFEGFAEVADDLSRQLIEGPIRSFR